MTLHAQIISQYEASLTMLHNAISACDKELWTDQSYINKFWHVAYHVLFYTDLYLSEDEKSFIPWEKHREHYQVLGATLPWPPHDAVHIGEPYSQEEIEEYCEQIQQSLGNRIEALDFDRPSGFFWLPFPKFELQFYNIRHLQHHSGQLVDRLRERKNVSSNWVGMGTAH
jgi:hypothetical protein